MKDLDKIDKKISYLKKDYFKVRDILNGMWDKLCYLHEDVSKLKQKLTQSAKKESK